MVFCNKENPNKQQKIKPDPELELMDQASPDQISDFAEVAREADPDNFP